jgi:transposase
MALSQDLRQRVVATYNPRKTSYEQVAEMFQIGVCTVRRWVSRKRQTGAIECLPIKGKPPKISETELPILKSLVGRNADKTLKELCCLWKEQTGIEISKSAMDRALIRAELPLKKRLFEPKNS